MEQTEIPIYFIRHTQSMFNLAQINYAKEKYGLDREPGRKHESEEIKYQDDLIDCGLTDLGKE